MIALQDIGKTQHPPSPKSVALWVLPQGGEDNELQSLEAARVPLLPLRGMKASVYYHSNAACRGSR